MTNKVLKLILFNHSRKWKWYIGKKTGYLFVSKAL